MWRIKESICEFKIEYDWLYHCDDHCYCKAIAFLIAIKRAIKCFVILCKPYKHEDIF